MDVTTIRYVAFILGTVCCLCLGGILALTVQGKDTTALSSLASTALGALVGLLVAPRNVSDHANDRLPNTKP